MLGPRIKATLLGNAVEVISRTDSKATSSGLKRTWRTASWEDSMSEENRLACDLLVKNARIFDGATLREGLSIGVTGDRISFVANSAVQAPQEIDAGGRFLMPGLIDCHIHLFNMWTAKDE